MQAMILSAVRSVLIAVGTAYAAKKGIDSATYEAAVGAFIAFAAAVWGVLDKRVKE